MGQMQRNLKIKMDYVHINTQRNANTECVNSWWKCHVYVLYDIFGLFHHLQNICFIKSLNVHSIYTYLHNFFYNFWIWFKNLLQSLHNFSFTFMIVCFCQTLFFFSFCTFVTWPNPVAPLEPPPWTASKYLCQLQTIIWIHLLLLYLNSWSHGKRR